MLRRQVLLACALAATLAVAPGAAQGATPKKQLYVSLGDSYASGYQPNALGVGRNTRNGFAYQVPALAAARGYRLQLVNFGCGGATTVSLMGTKGCAPRALGPGGRAYPNSTQLAAAESFLRKHRKQTALVTVSISGNDVTKCASAPDPIGCVTTAVDTINKNVGKIAKRLRKAAGKRVRIVGTTYPDVILGAWVNGDAGSRNLATLSVVAFKSLINPALKKAYRSANADFVDVTAASGAYTPLDADQHAQALRHRARGRGPGVRAHLLLRLRRHPRADGRLPPDRRSGGQAAAPPPLRRPRGPGRPTPGGPC